MKKIFLFAIAVAIGILFVTCKKEKDVVVTFNSSKVDAISHNSATFHASVEANSTITDRGICYSSQINTPTTGNSKISAGIGTGNFSVILIDLSESTVYYVRSYAVANGITYYGEVKTFKTLLNINQLTFTISEATNISHNSATFNASAAANTTITDRGICYSSQINTPTTENSKVSAGNGVGSFNVILTDLIENTVYYARPYAVINGVSYYGEVKTFKTLQTIDGLTFSISDAFDISHNSATFNASVAGNTTITNRGICYSSQINTPTTDNSKVSAGNGVGSFNVILTDLIESTVYYARPYAVANGVTYYGEVKTFKTSQHTNELTFILSDAFNISHNSATFR